MNDITAHVLRPGTAAIALAVVIRTFFTRCVVENLRPDLKHSKKDKSAYTSKGQMWWNSVVLYAIPVVYGCCTALVHSKWLFGDIDGLGGKVMFGGGVGWFASFLYKVFRKVIVKSAGVQIDDGFADPTSDSEPPAKKE